MAEPCCCRSGFCDFQMYGNHAVVDCPCQICLVKPTCLKICDKLNEHHKIIFGFNHEEFEKCLDLA